MQIALDGVETFRKEKCAFLGFCLQCRVSFRVIFRVAFRFGGLFRKSALRSCIAGSRVAEFREPCIAACDSCAGSCRKLGLLGPLERRCLAAQASNSLGRP